MFYIHLKINWPELFPGSDLRCITCSRHLDNLSRVSRLCLKLISFQTGIFSAIAYMCNKVIYPNPLTALFRVIPPLPRIYFKMVFSSTNGFVNPSFFSPSLIFVYIDILHYVPLAPSIALTLLLMNVPSVGFHVRTFVFGGRVYIVSKN